MALNCQSENDFFISEGTVDLTWTKPLHHTTPPSPMSQDAFCQMFFLYIYVWPYSNIIFEFTSFQTRKGGFLAPWGQKPRAGNGHYELSMAQGISYLDENEKYLAENILRAGPGSLPKANVVIYFSYQLYCWNHVLVRVKLRCLVCQLFFNHIILLDHFYLWHNDWSSSNLLLSYRDLRCIRWHIPVSVAKTYFNCGRQQQTIIL